MWYETSQYIQIYIYIYNYIVVYILYMPIWTDNRGGIAGIDSKKKCTAYLHDSPCLSVDFAHFFPIFSWDCGGYQYIYLKPRWDDPMFTSFVLTPLMAADLLSSQFYPNFCIHVCAIGGLLNSKNTCIVLNLLVLHVDSKSRFRCQAVVILHGSSKRQETTTSLHERVALHSNPKAMVARARSTTAKCCG